MEAPEKIYMTPSFGEPDNVLLASFSKSYLDYHRDIEYTRTDAFIEKAQNFFRQSHYLFCLDGMDLHNFIEDFKNYVKGE